MGLRNAKELELKRRKGQKFSFEAWLNHHLGNSKLPKVEDITTDLGGCFSFSFSSLALSLSLSSFFLIFLSSSLFLLSFLFSFLLFFFFSFFKNREKIGVLKNYTIISHIQQLTLFLFLFSSLPFSNFLQK